METEHSVSSPSEIEPSEIELIDDRILVKYIEPEEQTQYGVYLPKTAIDQKKERVQASIVVNVGLGRFTSDGRREAMMDILPGDIVFHAQFLGYSIWIGEEEYKVFGQHDLFGVKKIAPRDEIPTIEIPQELYEQTRSTLSTFQQMLQDGVDRKPTESELAIVDQFNLLRLIC